MFCSIRYSSRWWFSLVWWVVLVVSHARVGALTGRRGSVAAAPVVPQPSVSGRAARGSAVRRGHSGRHRRGMRVFCNLHMGRGTRPGRAPMDWAASRAVVGSRPPCVVVAVSIDGCGRSGWWRAVRVLRVRAIVARVGVAAVGHEKMLWLLISGAGGLGCSVGVVRRGLDRALGDGVVVTAAVVAAWLGYCVPDAQQ